MLYFHKAIKNRLKNRRVLVLPPGSPPSWNHLSQEATWRINPKGGLGITLTQTPHPVHGWMDECMDGWVKEPVVKTESKD